MAALDPRLHAYRPDLADAELVGRVSAERYVVGVPLSVCRGVLDLRRVPDDAAPLDTQLLFGETVACFERVRGWAWVRNESDGYVGYVKADGLSEPGPDPTHQVSALRTLLFPEPDLKSPVLDVLSMTSPVAVVGERGLFCEVAGGGWIHREHLAPLDQAAPDHVATALEFLGAPYLWGGRSSLGLDCSALIQVALRRAGVACPRDTDQQAAQLEGTLPRGTALRYGDLLYMRGHAAIALDEERVLHATAYGLRVRIEPLADLQARVEADRGITGIKRLA